MALLAVGSALGMGPDVVDLESRVRLSEAWSRAAIRLVAEPDTPSATSFEGAVDLAREAAEMAPKDADGWRVLLEISESAGDGFPEAVAASQEAAKRLSRFEPPDPVIWLSMLTQAIERQRTREARGAAYEKALSGELREKRSAIDGRAIDARLLFDRALLERRAGQVEEAQRSMRESFLCDPSYPPPAEALAGIAASSNVPPAELAKALVGAIAAEPSNVPSLTSLSRLCLAEGLYPEAERLLAIAVQVARKDFVIDRIDGLISEQMLALWGMRQHAKASGLATERQAEMDTAMLQQASEAAGGAAGPATRSRGLVTLPSTLHTIHAALASSGQLPDAQRAMRSAIASLESERSAAAGDPAAESAIDLQQAVLHVTIGDSSKVQPLLEAVEAVEPLSDRAKARFSGWAKLRGTFSEGAISDLEPIAEQDAVAKIGLGLALQAVGRKEDAEKALLGVVRTNRDNAFGLYAADCLYRIRPEPVEPTAEGLAIREAVKGMPAYVWKLAAEEGRMITGSLELDVEGGIFGRQALSVTLSNRSGGTLSLTPTGPIETRAALQFEITPASQPTTFPSPVIIPIDRVLRLQPNQTMKFEVDVARTPVFDELLAHAVSGLFVRARMYTNFRVTENAMFRGFLGASAESRVVSLPSMEVTKGWIEDSISEITHPDHPEDVAKLVSLAMALDQVAEPESAPGDTASAEKSRGSFMVRLDPAEIERGWGSVNAGWARLSPAAQAWALMVLPTTRLAALKPMLDQAKASTDTAVRTSLILRWIESPQDPLLESMIAGGTDMARADAATVQDPGSKEVQTKQAAERQARSLSLRAQAVRALLESRARAASELEQIGDSPAVLGGTVAPEMVLPTSR
jgi:tetratricopeptide (TPR) repeat protein